jgi:hypothetical protein
MIITATQTQRLHDKSLHVAVKWQSYFVYRKFRANILTRRPAILTEVLLLFSSVPRGDCRKSTPILPHNLANHEVILGCIDWLLVVSLNKLQNILQTFPSSNNIQFESAIWNRVLVEQIVVLQLVEKLAASWKSNTESYPEPPESGLTFYL